MDKILLLDTNISALPLYNFLIRNGKEVFVIGGNPNDFLAKTVKNYYKIDYSNIQKKGSVNFIYNSFCLR